MKRLSLVAAVLLLVGLLAGCGSSDSSASAGSDSAGGDVASGPPTDASVEDFCTTFLDLIQKASQQGDDVSDAAAVKLAKDAAADLAEVGTPADIPADARRAFEKAIELINSIPDDATRKEMDDIAGELDEGQQKDLQALTTYVTATCMPSMGGSDSPSSDASPSND
jgi:hypothetical protein